MCHDQYTYTTYTTSNAVRNNTRVIDLKECLRMYQMIRTTVDKALDNQDYYYCSGCGGYSTAGKYGSCCNYTSCCTNRKRIQKGQYGTSLDDIKTLLQFMADHHKF